MRNWAPLFLGVVAGAFLSHVIVARSAHACAGACDEREHVVLDVKSVEGGPTVRAQWDTVSESGALLTPDYLLIAVDEPQGQVEVELRK